MVQGQSTSDNRYAVMGSLSVVFWGMVAGFERLTTQTFGTQLGAAVMYLFAVALVFLLMRPERPSAYGWKYILFSGATFAMTDIFFAFSVGLSTTPQQVVEVSIVNYLWPTLVVLANLAVDRNTHANWLIVPGTLLATLGVATVVGGDSGFNLAGIVANVGSNPLPYLLALLDACSWTTYSVVTPRISKGKNALPYCFMATMLSTWTIWLVTSLATGWLLPEPGSISPVSFVAPVLAALVLVGGYYCWNVGILRGSMRVLSIVSYMTPVCNGIASAIILQVSLGVTFWVGLFMVVTGSILSFVATRQKEPVGKHAR